MNKALKRYRKKSYYNTKYWHVFISKVISAYDLSFSAMFNDDGILDIAAYEDRFCLALDKINGDKYESK